MKRKTFLASTAKWLMAAAMLTSHLTGARAFKGDDLTAGKKYYLFNIYQAKFLGADNKLQAPNIGAPIAFTATDMGFDISGTSYTATVNAAGYYQLKSGSRFLAFEEKQADPNNPNDENRAMYKGGGVSCKNTTNNTDRSYWQLVSEEEYAEWMAKKKITVASLNVDGMPKSVKVAGIYTVNLNPDATEGPGATAIGKKLRESGYDVVGVSEDFNFHSELWNAAWNGGNDVHYNATTHRGSISAGLGAVADYIAQKPVLDSDGLCLFYKVGSIDQATVEKSEKWVSWKDHFGYADSGADGLIKKGYRYYCIQLNDGTEIDLYTMHMDAESNAGDNAARESQMKQLVADIKSTSNKRPIIIIGDSNCRYTRDNIKKYLIDALNEDTRFTIRDPWIQYGRNNTYPGYGTSSIMASSEGYLRGEVVDKIWYVNNTESSIRLVAETYCQDLSFVNEEGAPLCDHKPCTVTFSYHEYDPATDDETIEETNEDAIYLRNRDTGRYLMNGGWWGSHAVVGNYAKPFYLRKLLNGNYELTSQYGHITDAAYVDNNTAGEYIAEWSILEEDGYKILSYSQGGTKKALTTNDPTYFNDNPLYRYATTATLNKRDKKQQWEIVSQKQMAEEMAKATEEKPMNVTHLVKAANFDRIDWDEHSAWIFDNKGNNKNERVADEGIGGIDNDAFCNYNRSVRTRKYGTSSSNQWDCYQVLCVPAGRYLVSNQGFEKGTSCTYLYAWSNPEGTYKEERIKLADYDADDFATGENQANAGRAFDKNKYVNRLPVIEVGEDGVLVIGVKKTENNATAGWTVFDNFQLHYLGNGQTSEPDGIQHKTTTTTGTEHYDLSGRRISAPTHSRFYIKNGKKVMTK